MEVLRCGQIQEGGADRICCWIRREIKKSEGGLPGFGHEQL
jgi:hypothetical protein